MAAYRRSRPDINRDAKEQELPNPSPADARPPIPVPDEQSAGYWAAAADHVLALARCVHCGSDEDLVAHHKLPRRFGGPDHFENLEPVCRSCHPRVEQQAAAEAELVWESPVLEGGRAPSRRRVPRPY